ncbi:MAG: hypothetical protein U1E42_08220 [Rhodospirillales bacterium]
MSDDDAGIAGDAGATGGVRQRDDRRSGQDRRCGRDRRGGATRQPLSAEPRPYGFREFSDRRDRQDRRIYGSDGHPWDRRRTPSEDESGDLSTVLTKDEIRFLFAQSRRQR